MVQGAVLGLTVALASLVMTILITNPGRLLGRLWCIAIFVSYVFSLGLAVLMVLNLMGTPSILNSLLHIVSVVVVAYSTVLTIAVRYELMLVKKMLDRNVVGGGEM